MAPTAKEGYSACTIYAIEDTTSAIHEYVYVGSCAKPLYARWAQHLHDTYYKNSSEIPKLLRPRPWEFKPVRLLGPFSCACQSDLNTIEEGYRMKYNPRCNMRCAKRGVVKGLKELVRIYVLPSCCIGRPKERFRQITVEEAWGCAPGGLESDQNSSCSDWYSGRIRG